jgi:hypothetical protein
MANGCTGYFELVDEQDKEDCMIGHSDQFKE